MRSALIVLLVCVAATFAAPTQTDEKNAAITSVAAQLCLQAAGSNTLFQQACAIGVTLLPGLIGGKRSAEEQRIIATITSTLSNLWAGLHPTIMPHVDNLLAEMLSHVGNAGQSLLGAISGISGAVTGGKRSAEDQKIIDALAGVLGGHLSEILNHGQLIAANLANTFLQNLLASLPGKRSVEEERIIATITSTLSNLWAGLHPTIMPHVDNLLAEMLSHVGNAGQSLLGAISGISGAVTGGKRSAEDQKIIDALTGVLGGHLSEMLTHAQVIAANLANTFLQNLLTSLPGKRSVEEQRLIANVMGAISSAQAGNWAQVATHVGNIFNIVGKRSVEEQRIIATITSTLSNLWAGLHPTIMPHVDNLLAEMLSHVGNAGASLLGAISGISGAVTGGY